MNIDITSLENQLDEYLPPVKNMTTAEKIELIKAIALVEQASALAAIAREIKMLGNGNAGAGGFGALECLTMAVSTLGDKMEKY